MNLWQHRQNRWSSSERHFRNRSSRRKTIRRKTGSNRTGHVVFTSRSLSEPARQYHRLAPLKTDRKNPYGSSWQCFPPSSSTWNQKRGFAARWYDSFRWRRQCEALESFRANRSIALTTHSQSLSLHFASSGTNASWTFFSPCLRINARGLFLNFRRHPCREAGIG
jgi:hypothetical protein